MIQSFVHFDFPSLVLHPRASWTMNKGAPFFLWSFRLILQWWSANSMALSTLLKRTEFWPLPHLPLGEPKRNARVVTVEAPMELLSSSAILVVAEGFQCSRRGLKVAFLREADASLCFFAAGFFGSSSSCFVSVPSAGSSLAVEGALLAGSAALSSAFPNLATRSLAFLQTSQKVTGSSFFTLFCRCWKRDWHFE